MKVLIVCSGTKGRIAPFITDQIESLQELGNHFEIFTIKSKGLLGYLHHYSLLKDKIKRYKPDLIHAHYGLSGLLANLQRKVPVVTTFHGSDINVPGNLKFSRLTNRLSAASIFVEEKMVEKVKKSSKVHLIPCGVDTSIFAPIAKSEAWAVMEWPKEGRNILFSSGFDNEVKNYPLAKKACELAEEYLGERINLIELKGYDRKQVSYLMNACNCVLLTSFSEGSPQFIKEAMACNCPVVSTNAGDVGLLLANSEGCYITDYKPEEVALKIREAIKFSDLDGRTNSRQRIFEMKLDSKNIALRVLEVYNIILLKFNKLTDIHNSFAAE